MTRKDPAVGAPSIRAMRAYAHVAGHPLVRARMQARSLYLGQQTQIAEEVADKLAMSKNNSQRMVRYALDLLGFGDADHTLNESRAPAPRRDAYGRFW
jgi:hypothetical protein